jgi:hypothetical protein
MSGFYDASSAAPRLRLTLTGVLLLSAASCYSERAFIDELPASYCSALFKCYSNFEADCETILCLHPDEATCEDTLTSWYEEDAGACGEDQRFSGAEGQSCLSDLARFDCVALTAGDLPPSCNRACE